jgi:hypothetical protein
LIIRKGDKSCDIIIQKGHFAFSETAMGYNVRAQEEEESEFAAALTK